MRNIESYKKEIHNRLILMKVLSGLAVLAMLLGNFYVKKAIPSKADITDYVIGFFTGLEIVFVFYIFKLSKVLKNEEELKEMYLKEYDERKMLINLKSGIHILPFYSTVMFVISLVVAYISYEAFIALTCAALGQIVLALILKIYWNRKL